jgi:hypothetical protein
MCVRILFPYLISYLLFIARLKQNQIAASGINAGRSTVVILHTTTPHLHKQYQVLAHLKKKRWMGSYLQT